MYISEVIIPNSVTSIGSGAFGGFDSLQKITLPFVGRNRTTFSTIGKAYSDFGGGAQGVFGYIFGGFVSHDRYIVTDATNHGQANGGTGTYSYQYY